MEMVRQVALTYTATIIIALAAHQAGRVVLQKFLSSSNETIELLE